MSSNRNVSRRSFLTDLFRTGPTTAQRDHQTASARRPRAFPLHRPPGAIAESEFLEACTRCGDCTTACPHDAITAAAPRLREAAGTPVIVADVAPCRMCADTPCFASCAAGALREDATTRMATATIEPWACLAQQGSFCTVCHEQCPVPGATRLEEGRPRIVADVCTGCGVCRFACPAPENAILLQPLLERPTTVGDSR
ncbi:MAG: 4Fe-4S binding protein [Planctomycetota bacterium]